MERTEMKVYMQLRLAISLCVVVLVGCAGHGQGNSIQQSAATGGLLAAGLGAGTGALVGNLIKNGDATKSALLGAGIALPIGALAGTAYKVHQDNKQFERNQETINQNHEHLARTRREMQQMRESMDMEAASFAIDEARVDYNYSGPSLGNYYR